MIYLYAHFLNVRQTLSLFTIPFFLPWFSSVETFCLQSEPSLFCSPSHRHQHISMHPSNFTYFAIITLPSSCNRSQRKYPHQLHSKNQNQPTLYKHIRSPHTRSCREYTTVTTILKGWRCLRFFLEPHHYHIISLNFDTLFLVWVVGRYLKTAKCSFIPFHSLPPPMHTITTEDLPTTHISLAFHFPSS